MTAISIPHPAALQAAIADPSSGQTEASLYTEVLRSEDASTRLLSDDARGLRALYGRATADVARSIFSVDTTPGGPVPTTYVEHYLSTLSDPATLELALHYYRANWPGLETTDVDLGGLRIAVPTLYIWGDQDFSVTPTTAHRCGSFVDASFQTLTYKGAGHWIPELAGARLTGDLLEHLNRNHSTQ